MTKTDGGLRPMLRRYIPQFAWTSIETGSTTSGVADSNYLSRDGIEGWVECKQTDASKITSLTSFQAAWLSRRARYGGRSWIACRRHHRGGPRLGDPVDELWLVPGVLAMELRSGGLLGLGVEKLWTEPQPPHARVWSGGPARWNWDAVAACLLLPVPVAFSLAALGDQRAGE